MLHIAHATPSHRSGVRQSCSHTMIALAISIGRRPGLAFCAASAAAITAQHDATHHAVSRSANHGGSRSARAPNTASGGRRWQRRSAVAFAGKSCQASAMRSVSTSKTALPIREAFPARARTARPPGSRAQCTPARTARSRATDGARGCDARDGASVRR